ncbi:MAG: phosphate ABC transporter permease PstA [Maioricimonas sp. JB049]
MRGRRENRTFEFLCAASTWSSFAVLVILLASVTYQAWGWLDWQFLTSFDSRKPERAGIFAGLLGSCWMILITILFSVPIGVGAAVYLEEYASDNLLTRIIRTNLANLAGVPSIVYGILGLTVFVRMFGLFGEQGVIQIDGIPLWGDVMIPLPFGRTVISGALALSLLILPVIIVAAQEALRAVPPTLRHASLALGATRWQTIRHQVLPASLPGILTGVILAISRAFGETAPLVMIGAMTFVRFAPGKITSLEVVVNDPSSLVRAPFDTFTVIPIQIFNWVRQAKSEFQHVAAAGIVVLLIVLLVLNGLAIYVRQRSQKNLRW